MSKHTYLPILIGAGGVASYFLPSFIRTFKFTKGFIVDGDTLEERNLDRQLFNKDCIGKNKAEALVSTLRLKKHFDTIPQYLSESSIPEAISDRINRGLNSSLTPVIICMVDNHPARRAAINIAEQHQTLFLMMANEYETSQAILHDFSSYPPKLAPQVRYPSISTGQSNNPISCQGVALESSPQLAMANATAASLGNLLLWQWDQSVDCWGIAPSWLPIEHQSTISNLETITYEQANKEILPK